MVSIALLLISIFCQSQEAIKFENEQLQFRSFNSADGLPSQIIHNTFQDRLGYLWVSTEEGIVRYDGYEFKTFYDDPIAGLRFKGASQFFEDREGRLWVLSGQGYLQYLDRARKEFVHYSLPLEGGWSEIGTHDMQEDTLGNLWVSGYGGLQYIDREQGTTTLYKLEEVRRPNNWPHPEKVRIGKLLDDGNGNIWCGSRKFGLIQFNKERKEFKLWRFEEGYYENMLDDWITDIIPYGDAKLLIGDHDRGLIIWDLASESVVDIINPAELHGTNNAAGITDLHYSGGPVVHIATIEDGAIVLDIIKKKIVEEVHPMNQNSEHDPGDNISHINQDRSGNYWIGGHTLIQGLKQSFQFDEYLYKEGEQRTLRHDNIYWIATDGDDHLLISTDNGVSVYNSKTREFDNSIRLPDQSFRTFGVLADSQSYWIGKSSNLFQIRKDDRSIVATYSRDIILDTEGNEFRRACRILKDSQGSIWTIDHWGRLKNINIKSNEVRNVFELAQDTESKKFINVISILDDPKYERLIVGTDFGLATVSYDLEVEWKHLKLEGLDLSKGIYSYLYRDLGNHIWAIIDGRVYKLNTEDWSLAYWPLNEAYDIGSFRWIVEEPIGTYWLSSFKGILKMKAKDNQGAIYYTPNIGGYQFHQPSPVAVMNGSIYFSGSKGLSAINTRKIVPNSNTRSVVITDLTVNNKQWTGAATIETVENVKLPFDQNDLDIRFSDLGLRDPISTNYEYRLLPRDNEWISNDKNRQLRFYNLDPDNYTLELRARNNEGVLNPTITALTIEIVPPWWQTNWAKGLTFIIGLSTILLYQRHRYHQRLTQQREIEILRSKISNDLHDDVGSILTGVAMQSELLEMTARPDQQETTQRIAEKSRLAISRMRDTVWAMDAAKDRLIDLQDRMLDYIEETLTPRQIHFNFENTIGDKNRLLKPNIRQGAYLIFKESITNIAKHSDTDHVDINMSIEVDMMILDIKDGGSKKEKIKSSGLGLNSMNNRAQKLGGHYQFTYDEGYKTTVKLPLT